MEKATQNDETMKTEWTAPSVEALEATVETEGGVVGPDDGLGGAGDAS